MNRQKFDTQSTEVITFTIVCSLSPSSGCTSPFGGGWGGGVGEVLLDSSRVVYA